jgi:hypothetical protein
MDDRGAICASFLYGSSVAVLGRVRVLGRSDLSVRGGSV